jgi:predicted secreted protein
MERGRKIVFVSHCILNQNTKPLGKERYPGVVKEILQIFSEADVGIVQLPCPHLEFFNEIERKPKPKSFYEDKGYRTYCKRLAKTILKQVENYLKSGYRVLRIIGIEFSPSCAVYQIENGNRVVPGKGILIEEIENEMRKKKFQVPIVGLNLNNLYATIEKIQALLKFG